MRRSGHIYNPSTADLSEMLVGRKVVSAERGDFKATTTPWSRYDGRLTLDDGTVLLVRGNSGGCICGAGDYWLTDLNAVDNVITKVEVERRPGGDEHLDYEGSYRIFVYAENTKINLATFTGSDGNGYYGTGFEIEVVPA